MEIRRLSDLDALERDAQGALDRRARPNPFERLEWLRLVGRFTPPGEPLFLRAENGESRAWLFLARRGAEAEAWGNWYTLRSGVALHAPNGTPPPLAAFSRGLREAGVSRLFLEPIAAEPGLGSALRRQGWATACGEVSCAWRTSTAGMSFADYWAGRPSRLRNTARRRAKSSDLTTVLHTDFSERAWDDYEAVFAASWKPDEGSPPLLREWARLEGAAGTLRLGLAYLDRRPVAAQFWTVENGTAVIHKLAYSESARHCSPGTVLSVEMFRRAIDVDRVEAIDFGIGDHPYKAEWMTERRPLYALTAYDLLNPRGLAGAARAAAQKLVRRPPSR